MSSGRNTSFSTPSNIRAMLERKLVTMMAKRVQRSWTSVGVQLVTFGVLASMGRAAWGQGARASVTSSLKTIATDDVSAKPTTVYRAPVYFEAPIWTRDGQSLLFDEDGRIMKIAVAGGEPQALSVGAATHCNGSHGLSPDGRLLAISCNMPGLTGSHVFIVPLEGGEPRQVTHTNGSYWHSWSPDGRMILFTHPEQGSLNIYSVAVDGTGEKALTSGSGTNDDPDFSPDGRYIYFCSDRSGTTQIWRMNADGSSAKQITTDDRVNWTPHVSPNGRQMVFISYDHGTQGHPANRQVVLRLISLKHHEMRDLVSLTGGSGTMNVASWSPDSKRLAFVDYEVSAQSSATTAPDAASAPAWAQPGSAAHAQVAPPRDFHRPSRNYDLPLGDFEGQSDVGAALVPGSARYDSETSQYTIHSAGYNIWYSRDEFRFLWKKMSGDVSLAADITFPDPNGYGDRKAVLMIRQSINDDSKTAFVALHGEGMIQLAERPEEGALVKDMEYRIGARGRPGGHSLDSLTTVTAHRIGIEKRGDAFSLFVSLEGEPMHQFGPPIQLHIDGPFYVGIGFASHLPETVDAADFSNVVVKNAAGEVR